MTEDFFLHNRYRLLNKLGEGSMGQVYRAQDIVLGQIVAVKIVHPALSADPVFLARFHREARMATSLLHPGIAAVYDVGQGDGRHFLVSEYVEGRDLGALLASRTVWPLDQAVWLATQMCAAVGYAHRAGFAHGRLKPRNVLVTTDGRVKVTDFGLARAFSWTPVTAGGPAWISPHYLAPEQVAGYRTGPAADVYAIGVMLYEMLAGRRPFAGDDNVEIALSHLRLDPPPVDQLNPGIPPPLARIIHKVLAREPSARYRTAYHLEQILLNYDRPPEAEPPTATDTAPPTPLYEDHERAGADWVTLVLATIATLAVLGLAPLWTAVYHRYTRPRPMPTPTIIATPRPGEVRVPNLVGMKRDEARRLVEEAGLRFAVIGQRHDDAVPALRVADQTLPPGQIVSLGETVGVIISQGPGYATVPDVVGQTFAQVQTDLADRGFTVQKQEMPSQQPPGAILAQEPAAGSVVRRGTLLLLTVSAGP